MPLKTSPKYHRQIAISNANFSRRTFLGALSAFPAFLRAPAALLSHSIDGFDKPLARARGSGEVADAIDFYRPPQLSLMVGFIKDPEHHNFSLEEWAKGIGKDFNAKKVVADAKSAGMVEIIWYDKWIDGLVFHKTMTTRFATERDFLADLGPECKRAGLKLIIYFNIFYDGNPEFASWACRDQRGNPIVFSPFWPANLLSMYSPFREKALEQINELLLNYGVDGLWLDVPNYATFSTDPWTQAAFRKQYGKTAEESTPGERRRFAVDSVVNWTQEVASYVRTIKSSAVVTYNGASDPVSSGPRLAIGMAGAVDYFSTELHADKDQQENVPRLSQYAKPVEAGYLVSDDWFTPLGSGPLKTNKGVDHIARAAAMVLGGGLNLYLALALGHDGTTDQGSIELLRAAGEWLKERREYLEGAADFSDVGIVLGTAESTDLVWPGGPLDYGQEVVALETSLRKAGYLPCRLLNCPNQQHWDEIPAPIRTLIIPDRVNLSRTEQDKVRSFLGRGGKVLAFARGAGLARSDEAPNVAEAFGVTGAGYLDSAAYDGIGLEWKGKPVSLKPPLILVRPKTANVLLWCNVQVEGSLPLLTSSPAGSGTAYFSTVTESAFSEAAEVLDYLWREAIGEPVWTIHEDAGRYLVTLRQQKGRLMVHIVDDLSWHGSLMGRYHPQYIHLRLNTGEVPFQKATVVPGNQTIPVLTDGSWKVLELYPNVEITVLLEGKT
jgi:hypothetical protein